MRGVVGNERPTRVAGAAATINSCHVATRQLLPPRPPPPSPFACPTGYLSISMVPSQLVPIPTQQKRFWSPWLSGKATSCNCCRSLPRTHGLEFEGPPLQMKQIYSSRKSVTRDLKRAKILDFVIQALQLVVLVVSDVRRALKRIYSPFFGWFYFGVFFFVCSWWVLQPSPRPFLLLYTTLPHFNLVLFRLFSMQLFQNFSVPYGVHVVYIAYKVAAENANMICVLFCCAGRLVMSCLQYPSDAAFHFYPAGTRFRSSQKSRPAPGYDHGLRW